MPGTDLALALGLLHLLDAAGAVDQDYVAARTTGWDDVRRAVAAWWPERVERVSGVPVAELRALAELLAGAERAMVLTARGAEQHAQGTDTVLAWIDVALALGLPGAPYSGYGCLTGQGNGQGGREHGQKADQLPGYRMHRRPGRAGARRRRVGRRPGRRCRGRGARRTSCSTRSAPPAARGRCWSSAPTSSSRRRTPATSPSALAALDLLVVADLVMSETAALADVVLPVTQWAEETGTMTNLEGRVILREQACGRRRRACAPTSRCSPGWPSGSGRRCRSPTDPEESSPSCGRASAGGRPTTPASPTTGSAPSTGVFWPCPDPGPPGHPAAVRRPVRARRRPGAVRRGRAPRAGRARRRASSLCT